MTMIRLSGRASATFIRAESGYVLILCATPKDDEFWFNKSAIIAWRFDGTSSPGPVTVGRDETCSNPQLILHPDGMVEDQDSGERFDTIEIWEVKARERWTADRAEWQWLAEHPEEPAVPAS
jgi:hypothetical protein